MLCLVYRDHRNESKVRKPLDDVVHVFSWIC
jgi:hypothetical protein